MKYINNSKPIRFRLIVGGEECSSVEDVKSNFDFNDLYKNFKDGKLTKWLSQIGETDLLKKIKKIEGISKTDMLTQKIRLYKLFAPDKQLSDFEVVKKLADKGFVCFSEIEGTKYEKNDEILEAVVEKTDEETLNLLCKYRDKLLRFVYSKKSYHVFNEKNCRRLIEMKIVSDEKVILEIASKHNFTDILERCRKK